MFPIHFRTAGTTVSAKGLGPAQKSPDLARIVQ